MFYATDQSQSVSEVEGNYDWTLTTNWYKDIFIDPALMNRSAGNSLYITLLGNASYSNVTVETSYGDTSTVGNANNILCSSVDTDYTVIVCYPMDSDLYYVV